MKSGYLILFAAVFLACSADEGGTDAKQVIAPEAASDWNLVLITLDTTRADALGAYGQPLDVSPHLDQMAAEGVLFEQAITSAPHTLAAHATIFTGLFPYAHGVRSNQGYLLSPQNHTLAEQLAEHGYRTGAEIATNVLRRDTRIAQGFEMVRDTDSPGIVLEPGPVRPDGGHAKTSARTGPDITQRGIEFIRNHREQKFFLWLHYFDAHNPYSAPTEFKAKIPESAYLAEVASLDAEVGRVLEEIQSQGLRERTLVVVTSDHGEGLGEHGELTHTFFVYETTMRIPLIVWGPASLPSGRRIEEVVRSVDILPTLLEWLDLPAIEGLHGRSLRALVEGERQDLGLVAYGEAVDLYRIFGTTPLRSLREGKWKYIHKVKAELYDLESDPAELTNLAAARPDVVARLREQLHTQLSERTAPPSDSAITIPADEQRDLAALGYVAPAAGTLLPDELNLLEEIGEDPTTLMQDLTQIATSKGLLSSHQWQRASERLGPLVERHPKSGHVAGLMARAQLGAGQYDEAIALFQRASELDPHDEGHVRRLVTALEHVGRSEDSIEWLSAFVDRNPCSEMRSTLSQLLHKQERYREEFTLLADGVAACPDSGRNLNDYAWALATSPNESLRDGALALEIATRAIENTDGEALPNYLDSLAAAYAEIGDFDAAVREEKRAIEILKRERAAHSIVFAYLRRLAELEARLPIRN